MTKRPAGSKKESFFLWSASGVHRVRKRIREAFSATAPDKCSEIVPSENRRYPRLDLKFPILYKLLGETSSGIPADVRPYLLAQSTNISPLGLCMNLGENLAPGTVLALTLHLIDRREKFHAIGRVTWTQPASEPGCHLTGVQFVVVEGESVKREEHSKVAALIREEVR